MITSQYHQKKILKYDHVAISSEEFSPHHRSDSNVSAFFINWEYWREEDRSNGNLFWKLLSWRTAMKGSASKLLRAYIFFTAIAIILSLVPLMSGQDTGKWKDSMEYFQVTGDYQRVVMASLKGLLELAGIVVQVISVLTSISLLRNVSPPKRAE
jgi:hypothetical protein